MEWVLRSPQIHSTFSNLGFLHADGYHINENCTAALETILRNILTEDKYLRSYRRSISFGQNIKKDLIPLLIHAKDDKVIELLIKIFLNLTIPVECLLLVDVISKNDFGRHTIFEINNLLASTKSAFTDHRATKVVVDFLKKHIYYKQEAKLPLEHCTNINNSLLLLRNIVHIPEELHGQSPNYKGPTHAVQNQILWNVFSQSIDKVLIRLMTAPDAKKWSVTMVQLIALLYKDQHVVTLQKFLNLWLEASLSESSEENESNTSPPDRGSDDSSPMLTSDPPSDSSDTGGSGKVNDETNSVYKNWVASFNNKENANRAFAVPPSGMDLVTTDKNDFAGSSNDDVMKFDNENSTSYCSGQNSEPNGQVPNQRKTEHKPVISENSDCGYGTLIDNQESISTSSDEDGLPAKKPVHQKPHNLIQKPNTNVRSSCTIQDRKKKKVVRRGKSNLYASTNVQGLSHKRPTDNDISNILKEFTIDFLLKGYNPLVKTLLSQILTNLQLEIDTSHFFWLVTYFLKFASQIELGLDHVSSVLSFELVSYLTAEGVNLCEQFELAIKLDGNDLKPCTRRLHLVVTAIREIIQTIDLYKKFPHLCKDDRDKLDKLHIQICETEEVRSLLVLLLRYYNPKYHTKQYLQDLIVTNHILLTFMDSATQLTEYKSSNYMIEHIQQFATSEMMYQYGLLLEDYSSNGEFVNDCIFTLMHHVGGELDSLITLFQPKILKIFSSIWKSEFEICDDWSDLIEYVINTFIKKPHALQSVANIRLDTENFDDDKGETKPEIYHNDEGTADTTAVDPDMRPKRKCLASSTRLEKWTDDEVSSLSWSYIKCSAQSNVIEEIIRLFKEDGIIKSRDSVINQLFKQNLINKDEFEKLVKGESDKNMKTDQLNKEMRDNEIGKLCKQLAQDGKSNFLDWVQKILLETCYVKIHLAKKSRRDNSDEPAAKIPKYDDLNEMHILSPISYHSLLLNQSVALVPWNHKQASICKDLKFLHLLHKLGFHMPVDSGKVFIRIPHFWSAQFMYDVAGKISPIDKSKFKFSINYISDSSMASMKHQDSLVLSEKLTNDLTMIEPTENLFQIHKQKHHATMVNFTPMPGNLISEVAEVDKHNWLEVVQKSQEYKIALNLESRSMEEDIESDVTMEPPTKDTPIFAAPLMPPIMSAKQDTSHFTVQVTESEYCNNSLCETASVASDLMQMYVSDEDEKPEVTVRPTVEANAGNNK